ncbi:MAG: alpha/beta hydrolase [Thermoproteota archaeon]|nr:alpha/beta hydrolase [Thermoproteota archaeon]
MNKQVSNQMSRNNTTATTTKVLYKTAVVEEGLSIFYREAGDPSNPKLLLLHGFPASSHQYRNLISALSDRFHIIAPDYPGFGNSDMPSPDKFDYTFDKLSEIIEGFLKKIGFTHFGLYMQDYGGPVGFRIISLHPEWLEWLIIQNSNAYEIGFTSAWDGLRNSLWKNRTSGTEKPLYGFMQLDVIKQVYLHGHKNPELISPDNWDVDYRFMERPNARRVQMDLFYDYRTNVALYPKWQKFLRDHQPKSLILWGQNDIFFTPEGGEAYLKDIPDAEIHRLDSGHFAVEDCLEEIVTNMQRFYLEKVVQA